MNRAFLFLLLCASINSHADPISWVNAVRHSAGSRPVVADELLSRTAVLWAEQLAAAGILSHRGDDGSTALDRYRALGGTEVRVGEILGAGPAVTDVEKGWMASRDHRRLALFPDWTHAGWGSVDTGPSQVTVMLFTEKLADPFLIARTGKGEGVVLSGRFIPRAAAGALLFNGLDKVSPVEWDPARGAFRFVLNAAEGYLRLGYLTAGGGFTLTNAFTWPPGTESPAGRGRFASPVPSP